MLTLALVASIVTLVVFLVLAASLFLGTMTRMGMGFGEPPRVSIMNYTFEPETLEIKIGATVRWTNMDMVDHTVTGGGIASGTLGHMGAYSFTFAQPGTYVYRCDLHPYMTGTVVVVT